jgi:GT2 family glycosyltransferase
VNDAPVAFIVCAFNNRDVIGTCLESIRQQMRADDECIVVDDASTDDTAALIAERFPWVRVLRNNDNIGPAASRNRAVATTDAALLAFVDSDVELAPGWLDATRAKLSEAPQVGFVGGKLVFADKHDRIDSYGGVTGRLGLAWSACEGQHPAEVSQPAERLWIATAAVLTRRELFERTGGFDAACFYGFEDSDLCWRGHLLGYRSVCVPDAVAFHHVNLTVSRMGSRIVFHYCKNRLRSMIKNYGRWRLTRYLPIYIAYALLDALLRPPRLARLRALWWNFTALVDTMRHRATIQRSRVVKDAELDHLFSRRWLPDTTLSKRRTAAKGALP